jgi:hypothetical protein
LDLAHSRRVLPIFGAKHVFERTTMTLSIHTQNSSRDSLYSGKLFLIVVSLRAAARIGQRYKQAHVRAFIRMIRFE